MLRTTLLATAATLTLTVSQLAAQQLAEGFHATTTPLPAGTNNVLTTATGRLYFDGFDLMHAVNGSTSQSLLTFASYTFGSFTTAIGATKVLFGESSNGGIWSVPLNGLAAQLIATVPFNYDAVMLDDDRALVSAKTGGFASPDNDVMFVDLITGQTQLLAQFPGASGPLTVDNTGNVYYATSPATFPAPTGTVTVLRLTSTDIDNAIATSTVLGIANAQVVIAGLDAAGDLAFDDDGDLFFVDWLNNRIGEINDADGNTATLAQRAAIRPDDRRPTGVRTLPTGRWRTDGSRNRLRDHQPDPHGHGTQPRTDLLGGQSDRRRRLFAGDEQRPRQRHWPAGIRDDGLLRPTQHPGPRLRTAPAAGLGPVDQPGARAADVRCHRRRDAGRPEPGLCPGPRCDRTNRLLLAQRGAGHQPGSSDANRAVIDRSQQGRRGAQLLQPLPVGKPDGPA